jgi:hypothetical protein
MQAEYQQYVILKEKAETKKPGQVGAPSRG